MRAHLFSNPLRHSRPQDPVRQTNRELPISDLIPEHRGNFFRGLLIAVALSVPFWLALYFLLR